MDTRPAVDGVPNRRTTRRSSPACTAVLTPSDADCGTALYKALFAALEHEDVRTVVAGVSLPNPASLSFHEKFGFRPVGVFHAVGRKFDKFWDVAWFERPLRLNGPDPTSVG